MLPAAAPPPSTTEIRKLAAEVGIEAADADEAVGLPPATAGALAVHAAGVPAHTRVSGLRENTRYVAYFTAQDQVRGVRVWGGCSSSTDARA